MIQSHVLTTAANHSKIFNDGFVQWLTNNYHVFEVFCELTDKVRARGHRHYSARTILEKMRYETSVSDDHGTFKLTDRPIPDFARLYVLLNPERVDMFTYRREGVNFPAYMASLQSIAKD